MPRRIAVAETARLIAPVCIGILIVYSPKNSGCGFASRRTLIAGYMAFVTERTKAYLAKR